MKHPTKTTMSTIFILYVVNAFAPLTLVYWRACTSGKFPGSSFDQRDTAAGWRLHFCQTLGSNSFHISGSMDGSKISALKEILRLIECHVGSLSQQTRLSPENNNNNQGQSFSKCKHRNPLADIPAVSFSYFWDWIVPFDLWIPLSFFETGQIVKPKWDHVTLHF